MKRRGPWSPEQVDTHLDEAIIPMRLACNGASGQPVIASLWFMRVADELWTATQRSARVVEHLRRDPRCAFEVAGETAPYRGVRGQGEARIEPDRGEEVLRQLVCRYLGSPESDFAKWLLSRADTETAIAVAPDTMLSWDFSSRMRGVR